MERGAGKVTCSEDSCSRDEPLRESLKRSGELNSCSRRNNCKDPKTEEEIEYSIKKIASVSCSI